MCIGRMFSGILPFLIKGGTYDKKSEPVKKDIKEGNLF